MFYPHSLLGWWRWSTELSRCRSATLGLLAGVFDALGGATLTALADVLGALRGATLGALAGVLGALRTAALGALAGVLAARRARLKSLRFRGR